MELKGIIELSEGLFFDADNKHIILKTNHGKLIASPFNDPDYPAINIDFLPEGQEIPISIAMVEDASPEVASSETNGEAVVVRVWSNPWQEDYIDRNDILIKDINEAVNNNQ